MKYSFKNVPLIFTDICSMSLKTLQMRYTVVISGSDMHEASMPFIDIFNWVEELCMADTSLWILNLYTQCIIALLSLVWCLLEDSCDNYGLVITDSCGKRMNWSPLDVPMHCYYRVLIVLQNRVRNGKLWKIYGKCIL